MANTGTVIGGVAKSGGGFFSSLFGRLLKIKWAYIFIIILFVQALMSGIDNGGGIEIIRSLGERFFNITQGLQSTSIEVIENEAVFNYLSFVVILWALFSNIYLVYLWIRLFDWIFGKSPFSNESEGFKNFAFAVILFLILQIFYLFLFTVPPEGQTYFDLFKTPILAFRDFFKAVVLIFTSTSFNKVIESSSINVCVNSSTCVM